jgi:hypothetical protein
MIEDGITLYKQTKVSKPRITKKNMTTTFFIYFIKVAKKEFYRFFVLLSTKGSILE